MRTIIAPTDFSEASLNAVDYAADLAVATGSNLMLVHVIQVPVVYGEVPIEVITIEERTKNAEEKISNLKNKIVTRTNEKISISTDVSPGGPIVREIENYCKSVDPSFVVMGSQGNSVMERLLFGSNTITAMKKLSWPLIIVPGEATFKKLNNVGFACDLRTAAATLPVEEISMLVGQFNATLHVIYINTENKKRYAPDLIDECSQLQEMLRKLHPMSYYLINSSIEEGLSVFSAKNNLDLLIIIPKSHGFIRKLFHKSLAKQLIVHTQVPVLSMHE